MKTLLLFLVCLLPLAVIADEAEVKFHGKKYRLSAFVLSASGDTVNVDDRDWPFDSMPAEVKAKLGAARTLKKEWAAQNSKTIPADKKAAPGSITLTGTVEEALPGGVLVTNHFQKTFYFLRTEHPIATGQTISKRVVIDGQYQFAQPRAGAPLSIPAVKEVTP